jgi:hypothetical protein
MFDAHAASVLAALPVIPGLEVEAARRTLSAAYFLFVARRLDGAELPPESETAADVRRRLRRLASSLERVVLSPLSSGDDPGRAAAAFAAAEALSLLRELGTVRHEAGDPLLDEAVYTGIEAALLYMIAGYDADASAMARDAEVAIGERKLKSGTAQLASEVISLCYSQPTTDSVHLLPTGPSGQEDVVAAVRDEIATLIAKWVHEYRQWLCGTAKKDVSDVLGLLTGLRAALAEAAAPASLEPMPYSNGGLEFADLYHLAGLLHASIAATAPRAAIVTLPVPQDDRDYAVQFEAYLRQRCLGGRGMRARPFIWPSAAAYVEECIKGDRTSAVVSMPTGSGKSHLAEIAAVEALSRGWVLYLAPTNALVSQIRRDLSQALKSLTSVKVTAFLGEEEYTPLVGAEFPGAERSVRVMTPEKASLFLRLYPEAYGSCSLCLVDECHLLGDDSRGPIVDALIAHVATINDTCSFLLMSAMLSNAAQLAEWIGSLRNGQAAPLVSGWRPSRTMRGLVALDQGDLSARSSDSRTFFRANRSRRNVVLDVPLVVVVGLSGPWSEEAPADYMSMRIQQSYGVTFTSTNRTKTPGWKNHAGRAVAEALSRSGLPAINFILANKHHAFASALRVADDYSNRRSPDRVPDSVESMLVLAEAELGVQTELRALLNRGVAVHTSAMLPMERQASETMFISGAAPLMFATGTLAQGLNLPAEAIVVSGTTIGDPREPIDPAVREARAASTILNSFGRAGRPGFSNHGIALLVTDHPYPAPFSAALSPISAREQYPVMTQEDACVDVHSPIERLIDAVLAGEDLAATDDAERDQFLVLLSESDAQSSRVLRRTFGAYHRREQLTDEILVALDEAVAQGRKRVIESVGAPPFVIDAAIRSGITVERAANMWVAYRHRLNRTDFDDVDGVNGWAALFLGVLKAMPLERLGLYLPKEERKTKSFADRLFDAANSPDPCRFGVRRQWVQAWRECENLLLAYMSGEDYAGLARRYVEAQIPVDPRRSDGAQPLPKTLDLTSLFFYRLSVDAGCFVALREADVAQREEELPEALAILPQAIRNGCDSPACLSWFTETLQNRIVAHKLSAKFPPPPEADHVGLRAGWIRNQAREWARSAAIEPDRVLSAAKTLLKAE